MPAWLQSRCDLCHPERSAGFWVSGGPERMGWNPGPPARPYSARVEPSARDGGFGVKGEDQDPSGSRRGEGTAPGAGLAYHWPGRSASGSWAGSLSGLAAGGSGARRNHPAGGATPGQELSRAAGSPTAGWLAAGWLAADPSAAGWLAAGSAAGLDSAADADSGLDCAA